MVTDNQVKILKKLINQEQKHQTAAAKAGMSEETARWDLTNHKISVSSL